MKCATMGGPVNSRVGMVAKGTEAPDPAILMRWYPFLALACSRGLGPADKKEKQVLLQVDAAADFQVGDTERLEWLVIFLVGEYELR